MHDARLAVRKRPRQFMFLLFGAAFSIIILLSRYSSFAEPMEATSLGPHSPSPFQNTAVEPVNFALIMFTENSATEGAILVKVSYLSNFECKSRLANKEEKVCHNVRDAATPLPYHLR